MDACVLYPPLVRRLLLAAAGRGLLRPLWSARVLEEWARAAERRHGLDEGRAVRAEGALLDALWPEASVPPAEGPAPTLPDPDDAHVLAAALAGRAEILVTFNLRDFPAPKLRRLGLAPLHPDAALWELWGAAPELMRAATAEALAAHVPPGAPSPSAEEGPRLVKRAGLPRLARLMRREMG
ncbi:RSP_2648 family PIN domain-containing protein [Oceanicella actignis]|uniref:RSP_2648 family PIN domain-containing protein n=1 Tax=Oceanicella actignis TaxID=1189325 RepID=UPI0009354AA8|nr:PIN domain-containing protein [Oceanicella actignis]